MSLDWNVAKVKDNETLCFTPKRELQPLTHALIWVCMSIDLHGITEKNYEDFWMRVWIVEKITGPLLWRHDGPDKPPTPLYTTLEDVKKHIGLSTNCSTRTFKQFLRSRVMEALEREARAELRRSKASTNAAEEVAP